MSDMMQRAIEKRDALLTQYRDKIAALELLVRDACDLLSGDFIGIEEVEAIEKRAVALGVELGGFRHDD